MASLGVSIAWERQGRAHLSPLLIFLPQHVRSIGRATDAVHLVQRFQARRELGVAYPHELVLFRDLVCASGRCDQPFLAMLDLHAARTAPLHHVGDQMCVYAQRCYVNLLQVPIELHPHLAEL